jgi:hypothetical protein
MGSRRPRFSIGPQSKYYTLASFNAKTLNATTTNELDLNAGLLVAEDSDGNYHRQRIDKDVHEQHRQYGE